MPKRADKEEIDPTLCRVDRRPILSNGSKSALLCSRCYQRRRRGVPLTPEFGCLPAGEGATLPQVRVSRDGRAMVVRLAKREGVRLVDWIRRAVMERAERQGETGPLRLPRQQSATRSTRSNRR